MKKIILPLLVILLFGIAIYTVADYNKNKVKDLEITTKEASTLGKDSDSVKDSASVRDSSIKNDSNAKKIAALNFKLKDLNGKDVSLNDFKGKRVFLNFWASWCSPCKAEMPDIEKLYAELKDSNLVILTINIGEDKNTVKSFIGKNKYNFTVLLDLKQKTAGQYNIGAIPTSFFIDKEGNIVATVKGGLTTEQMKNNISKL